MSDNGNIHKEKPSTVIAWVKVTARADKGIEVETPNMDMDNPKNVAAIIDLLAAGVSALCHTRLAKLGTESRIVPASIVPKIMRNRG